MGLHLELLERRLASGFLPGLCQPGLLLKLRIHRSLLESSLLLRLEAALAQWLPGYAAGFAGSRRTPDDFLALLLQFLDVLQEQTGTPRFSRSRFTLDAADNDTWQVLLLCPVLGSAMSAHIHAFDWLLQVLNRSAGGFADDEKKTLDAVIGHFAHEAPSGAMSARFLQVANEMTIPWRHVVDNVYQLGWGCRARLLDSTLTDRTSNIGVRMARSKSAAAQVLRAAGFPVPRHLFVASVERAEAVAAVLGYPVVIKPDAEDGGRGVFAGLRSADSLRKAWYQARRVSDRILVERHITGRDYRVYVLDGEVIHVVLRIPGGVTGDGRHTVTQLLAALNADPRRHQLGRWQPIALDEEAEDLLLEQALTADSVPGAGVEVRLRRSANVHTGGTPHDVPLEAVHPDNRDLCARAAALLRLDLAGVDFLIPDIGISWRDSLAGICEVNAQPQMPPGLPARILTHLFPQAGRIPVIVVLDNLEPPWLGALLSALHAAGRRTGLATQAGDVWIGDSQLAALLPDSAAAAGVLLGDPQLELAIFLVGSTNQLQSGVPVDRCDLLVLGGDAAFATHAVTLGTVLLPRSARTWLDAGSTHWQSCALDLAAVQTVSCESMPEALLQLCEALL